MFPSLFFLELIFFRLGLHSLPISMRIHSIYSMRIHSIHSNVAFCHSNNCAVLFRAVFTIHHANYINDKNEYAIAQQQKFQFAKWENIFHYHLYSEVHGCKYAYLNTDACENTSITETY